MIAASLDGFKWGLDNSREVNEAFSHDGCLALHVKRQYASELQGAWEEQCERIPTSVPFMSGFLGASCWPPHDTGGWTSQTFLVLIQRGCFDVNRRAARP